MKKTMTRLTIIFFSVFIVCLTICFITDAAVWETLCITFGVISYHFIMRLAVGLIIDRVLKNSVDHRQKWFCVGPLESKLYELLGVKKWKHFVPAFQPDYFDIKKHSLDEILGAMCQAEIIHEVIILLSFAPLILSLWFEPLSVFFATSMISACIDLVFVILQRYNRPRVLKLLAKKANKGV